MKNPNLSVGASGDEVADLHRKLLALGFSISASELDRKFFGPATREVARECQRESSLKSPGWSTRKQRPRSKRKSRGVAIEGQRRVRYPRRQLAALWNQRLRVLNVESPLVRAAAVRWRFLAPRLPIRLPRLALRLAKGRREK